MDTVEFAYYSRARPFIAVGPRLGGPQAGYAVLLDCPLPPGAKLLDRQVAAHTCLLDADDADADGLDDGGFAPGGPVRSFRPPRRNGALLTVLLDNSGQKIDSRINLQLKPYGS